MARNLATPMITGITSALIIPVFLVTIQFKSETCYIWNGTGPFTYGGFTYTGIGSLGKIGPVSESVDLRAEGTSVMLSGIDPVLFGEAMTDIQIGAPASIAFGLWNASTATLITTPYDLFVGVVSKPTVLVGDATLSITLSLENKLIQLQRATNRRYTAADQGIYYSDDMFFNWVEILNDIALKWGSS
jgi:hypothetical protein